MTEGTSLKMFAACFLILDLDGRKVNPHLHSLEWVKLQELQVGLTAPVNQLIHLTSVHTLSSQSAGLGGGCV